MTQTKKLLKRKILEYLNRPDIIAASPLQRTTTAVAGEMGSGNYTTAKLCIREMVEDRMLTLETVGSLKNILSTTT